MIIIIIIIIVIIIMMMMIIIIIITTTMIITIIIIIIIIMIIIIIIAAKGTIRDILQSPHCAANCFKHIRSKCPGPNRVQTTCNTSSACHMQHVVCHVVPRDSSAIEFDRV